MRNQHINELAATYATSTQFIRSLLQGGIAPDDIQEVLDMRRDHHVRVKRGVADYATASELIALYHLAEGDIEMMTIALEQAIAITKKHFRGAVYEVVARGKAALLYGEPQSGGTPWWCYYEDEELDEIGVMSF